MRTTALAILISALMPLSIVAQEISPDTLVPDLVAGQNSFTWSLFQALGEPEGNVCISPYNVQSALQLAYMGAEGTTKQQMAKTLFLPPVSDKSLAATVQLVEDGLPSGVANAKACAIDSSFLPTDQYLRTVTETLDADVFEVDFKKQPKEALKSINSWVSEMTQDHIKDLLTTDDIKPSTRLVLLSAIYLKARWTAPFAKENTKEEPFHTLAGRELKVPMMYQKELMRLYQDDNVQLVFREFESDDDDESHLEALIVLPRTLELTRKVYGMLSNENLKKWDSQATAQLVEFSMPKCSLKQKYRLKSALQSLGMTQAFTDKADFTNISPELRVCIDDVIHEAYMQIDEEGVIATGATAVKMVMTAIAPVLKPTVVVHCDRPYFVILRDKTSGALLFVSLLSAPEKIQK